jgi:hypothetical protein
MKSLKQNWQSGIVCATLATLYLICTGLPAYTQTRYDAARDLVARTQEDLRRAADFTSVKKDERERIVNTQKHLSDFDRGLTRHKFDKDKLNDAIEDLKNVVEHNTLGGEDRDALTRDLGDLRAMRARHD